MIRSRLQGGCRVHGARSLSDYARSCVLRDLSIESSAPGIDAKDSRVQEINQKVVDLESRINDLLKMVDALRLSATQPELDSTPSNRFPLA